MDLYLDNIIDHGQNPRNFGDPLNPADIDYEDDNPFCGDRLHLTVQLDENQRVSAVAWEGEGCTISQASASMLGEEIMGKSLNCFLISVSIRDLSKSPTAMTAIKSGRYQSP